VTADNVTLLAFAAARRPFGYLMAAEQAQFAAERRAAAAAVERYISCPPFPRQQTRRSGVQRPNDVTDRRTEGRPTVS